MNFVLCSLKLDVNVRSVWNDMWKQAEIEAGRGLGMFRRGKIGETVYPSLM